MTDHALGLHAREAAMPGQSAGDSPGFVAPMLATGVAGLPPDTAEFVAEEKWDGLRACIAVADGRVRPWSQNGRDITAAYPELGALAAAAGRRVLVLDGEIVALSGPRPDFTALQRRMTAGRPGAGLLAAVPVTLIVFDVLRSGRDHLAGRPYVLRRVLLEDVDLEVPGIVQVPPAFPGDAAALLAATQEQGYEGIVLKRPASLYHPGRRTRDWLKGRNIHTVDVRVGGWLPGTGARAHLAGSVLMGIPRPGTLKFAGTLGSGLSMAELRELTGLLASLEQPASPFTGPRPLRSPGTPGGPAPPSPPRSPTWNAPRPGGYANRYGVASDPARSRPPLKPRVDGQAGAREPMPNDSCSSNVHARPAWRTRATHSWTANGLFEYQSIVLEQSFAGGRRLPLEA